MWKNAPGAQSAKNEKSSPPMLGASLSSVCASPSNRALTRRTRAASALSLTSAA